MDHSVFNNSASKNTYTILMPPEAPRTSMTPRAPITPMT